MKSRKAYPGAPLSKAIELLGLNGPAIEALRGVLLDGKPILEHDETLRTPKPFEIRPTTKFREAVAAAVAFASIMGMRNIEISSVDEQGRTRENPDLRLVSADQSYDVEAVRVDETSALRTRLHEVHSRVLQLVKANPQLKLDYLVLFTIDYEKAKELTSEELRQLGDELCDFFAREYGRMLPPGYHSSVFPAGTVAHRVGLVVRVDRPPVDAGIALAQADEMTPYDLVVETIQQKRTRQYVRTPGNELWLVVEVADPRGPFRKTIHTLKEVHLEISPFDHVIVYDSQSLAEAIL